MDGKELWNHLGLVTEAQINYFKDPQHSAHGQKKWKRKKPEKQNNERQLNNQRILNHARIHSEYCKNKMSAFFFENKDPVALPWYFMWRNSLKFWPLIVWVHVRMRNFKVFVLDSRIYIKNHDSYSPHKILTNTLGFESNTEYSKTPQ